MGVLPGVAPRVLAYKVLVDQVFASPALHSLFLPFMALAEGGDIQDAWQRLSTKFIPMMQMNYCLWPFVHVVTFSVIPLHHRVVWVNCWAAVWMGMLSTLNAKKD